MTPQRLWTCFCGTQQVQTGPRAQELIPTPPVGWALVAVTVMLPERTEAGKEGKTKMGESRNTQQFEVCNACLPTLITSIEALKSHPATPSPS